MPNRFQFPFHHIASTSPSFEVSLTGADSTANALQSTGLREWSGPSSRAVRFATRTADDYLAVFGTSDINVGGSTDGMLILGGTVEVIQPTSPRFTHIALQSSTDVTINITLGYGQ